MLFRLYRSSLRARPLPPPPPKKKTWETNSAEIVAYLRFCILMELNNLPDLYDYWSPSPVFHYFPIASRIPRKRFKGRFSLKQYVTKKPIKCSFKVWARADSKNFYVCEFKIYTGKDGSLQENLGQRL